MSNKKCFNEKRRQSKKETCIIDIEFMKLININNK